MDVKGGVEAKFLEVISRAVRDRIGDGERILGGLGGGADDESMLNIALGGGGKGPAFECRPGS